MTHEASAYVRHPQYIGFIGVLFGFLLQWSTILTLAMFPLRARLSSVERAQEAAFEGELTRATAEVQVGAALARLNKSLGVLP